MLNCTCSGIEVNVLHCLSFWSWLLVPLGQSAYMFVCAQACWTFWYASCCTHILPIAFLVWTRYTPFPLTVCIHVSENLQLIAGRITILVWCRRQMTSTESKRASSGKWLQAKMFQDLDASPIGSYDCFVAQSSSESEVCLRTLRIMMADRSAAHVSWWCTSILHGCYTI